MVVNADPVKVWERPQGPCPPYVPGMQHCHIGSRTVVEGMWQRLGTSMDWSLAIHPYGNPSMVHPCLLLPLNTVPSTQSPPAWHKDRIHGDAVGPAFSHVGFLSVNSVENYVMQIAWPATYHFADVERIGAFQMAHLRALGVKDAQNWPQAKIAATEQGWNVRTWLSNLNFLQASIICQRASSHSFTSMHSHSIALTVCACRPGS